MSEEVVHLAQPAVYGGRANIIASPFQFLFSGEDNLRIVTVNALAGVTLIVRGRFQRLNGEVYVFDQQFVLASDRSTTSFNIKLGEGYLLNLGCIATGAAPLVGQTYVQARLMRGFTGALFGWGSILGGFVTSTQFLSYPGSPIVMS